MPYAFSEVRLVDSRDSSGFAGSTFGSLFLSGLHSLRSLHWPKHDYTISNRSYMSSEPDSTAFAEHAHLRMNTRSGPVKILRCFVRQSCHLGPVRRQFGIRSVWAE